MTKIGIRCGVRRREHGGEVLVRLIELTQLDEGASEDCSGDDIDATVADSPRKGVVAHGLGTAH